MGTRLTVGGIVTTLTALLLSGLVAVPAARAAACVPIQTNVGTDVVLTFDDTTAGGCEWTPPPWVTQVRVLVVGGGGGGGVNGRGGGGGGGVREDTYTVTPGTPVTVTVGRGGSGAYYGPSYTGANQFAATVSSTNGGDSSFGTLISLGGGFGSGCYSDGTLNAGSGGSGGGSSGCVAGTGTVGQGYNGSTSGGGGGAGAAGSAGNGGAGKSSDITSVADDTLGYGGGGGIGSFSSATGGSATPGDGGGRGGSNAYGPDPGVNGRGGGGGGGGLWDSPGSAAGARGGDGVVIVRYAKGTQSLTVAATPNPVRKTRQATLSATGYSGTGTITYAVTSGGTNCSISGATLTALDVGTCNVTATIAADANYLAATSAPATVTVLLRYPQTITVVATPPWVYVPGAIGLSATGYSGTGAISYAIVSGSGCSLSGSTVTMTSGGSCQVRASIAQDDTYAAATSAPATVTGQWPPTPPSPPYLTALRPGNGQIAVDWTRPDSEGTSPITEYRVYAAPGGLVCTVKWSGQIRSTCLVKPLTNGKPYEFWVTAVNDVGESQPSRRMTGIPRPDLPSAPIFTSIRPGNEQATAAWSPPTSDGGGTISEYRVYSYSGTRLCTVKATEGPPYSCVITGLQNTTSYQMRVTAVNESGEGPPSTWLSVMPNPVRPGVPRSVAARAGNFRIDAAWDPPADEGTYPVESYQVWLEGIGSVCTVAAPQTSCEIPDLVPGQTYRVQVRAWSKAGWGNLSSSSSAVVTVPPPNIGYPEVRRNRKEPTRMKVTIGTTGIRPGTRLYTLPPKTGDEYDRPVVGDDGVAIWKANVPLDKLWYVMWCTDSRAEGLCSPRTLLVDPDS